MYLLFETKEGKTRPGVVRVKPKEWFKYHILTRSAYKAFM